MGGLFWVGGSDQGAEGTWYCVDGQPMAMSVPFWGTGSSALMLSIFMKPMLTSYKDMKVTGWLKVQEAFLIYSSFQFVSYHFNGWTPTQNWLSIPYGEQNLLTSRYEKRPETLLQIFTKSTGLKRKNKILSHFPFINHVSYIHNNQTNSKFFSSTGVRAVYYQITQTLQSSPCCSLSSPTCRKS